MLPSTVSSSAMLAAETGCNMQSDVTVPVTEMFVLFCFFNAGEVFILFFGDFG